jgi:hypothetical protein
MRNLILTIILVCPSVLAAQSNFDPRDFTGMYDRVGHLERREGIQVVGGCAECGDPGFGKDVPPFTPEGQRRFDANKPAYGRAVDLPKVSQEHIGRQRAVLSALSNDPTFNCEPLGVTRLILDTYFAALEFVHTRDRILQHLEWTNEWREIWMDGRELPAEPDLPRWFGYSVGRWDGDTLVVNSFGHDERTWIDYFGYPHSDQMRLEERYRRIDKDKIEVVMTVNDPVIYTRPWVSEKKILRRLPPGRATLNGWTGLLDDRCVPTEEAEFKKKITDPSGGISHEK